MKIPVLIEPIANDGFRATGGPPFAVSAQGTTREEALARLREAIDHRMVEGAVLVPLEIDTTEENPWIAVAGMFRDDPLFDEWQEAIAEYRRKVDEDAGRRLPMTQYILDTDTLSLLQHGHPKVSQEYRPGHL